MPELCRFLGIIIYMYREVGGKHHYPHIHADYAGEGDVFEGTGRKESSFQ